MTQIIKAEHLSYEYTKLSDDGQPEETVTAVDNVDLDVEPGQFIAILGHNGSGKSTLAKHINALLLPTAGRMIIDGHDTSRSDALWQIRQTAGMVFQNPDNQIIGTVVDEDVAFGPENMGIEREGILARVRKSLTDVGMWEMRSQSPNRLSGGQKQRVAIAGVVAMQPKCIVMDEPTAMLDPSGRREVLRTARQLNREANVTVIWITHYMEEVVEADRLIVMDQGHIVMQGTPGEIFARVEELHALRLDVPPASYLAWKLRRSGVDLPDTILTMEELADALEGYRVCRSKSNI